MILTTLETLELGAVSKKDLGRPGGTGSRLLHQLQENGCFCSHQKQEPDSGHMLWAPQAPPPGLQCSVISSPAGKEWGGVARGLHWPVLVILVSHESLQAL